MYLGIDFLISPTLQPYLIEVNVGMPGGAQEYHLTHLVHLGKPSDIFTRIEGTSRMVYGKTFKDYLHSLPFIESLKPFKLWMDGKGPLPPAFHPGLRLEDKWVQYQLLNAMAPMPETVPLDPKNRVGVDHFFSQSKKVVLKRRLGRGGRGLVVLDDPSALWHLDLSSTDWLLQEHVDSKFEEYSLSIRAVAYAGEFLCMYANLSRKTTSNHGILTFVSPGRFFGLNERVFRTQSVNQKSWEAEIWFGDNDPEYLRHNLYEDEVSTTALNLPESLYQVIRDLSVRVERLYERTDLSKLPKACFEDRFPASEGSNP